MSKKGPGFTSLHYSSMRASTWHHGLGSEELVMKKQSINNLLYTYGTNPFSFADILRMYSDKNNGGPLFIVMPNLLVLI